MRYRQHLPALRLYCATSKRVNQGKERDAQGTHQDQRARLDCRPSGREARGLVKFRRKRRLSVLAGERKTKDAVVLEVENAKSVGVHWFFVFSSLFIYLGRYPSCIITSKVTGPVTWRDWRILLLKVVEKSDARRSSARQERGEFCGLHSVEKYNTT